MDLHTILSLPLVRGAIAGILTAAVVDFHAFQNWKNFDEALHYDWRLAAFRWFQGAVMGALTGAGLFAIS